MSNFDKILNNFNPENVDKAIDFIEDKIEGNVVKGVNWGGRQIGALMQKTESLESFPKIGKHVLQSAEGLAASAVLYFLGSWTAIAMAITNVAKLALDGLKMAYYKFHSSCKGSAESYVSDLSNQIDLHFDELKGNLIRFVSFKVNALILAFESIFRPEKVRNQLVEMDFKNTLFIGIPLHQYS